MGWFYCASDEKIKPSNIPRTTLVGTQPEQIINTLDYYKNERKQEGVQVPELRDIPVVDKVSVIVAFPLLHVKHFIDAEVVSGFTFNVNANAFDEMKRLGRDYERLRRGDLYKFKSQDIFGTWFLPREVMEGVKKYDWNQHLRQINTWMAQREETLDEAQRRGHILRVRE